MFRHTVFYKNFLSTQGMSSHLQLDIQKFTMPINESPYQRKNFKMSSFVSLTQWFSRYGSIVFVLLSNFSKWIQNLYFWTFKIAFQLDICQYLKNHLTKIVHWSHYTITIDSLKCLKNESGKIDRSQRTGARFFQITLRPQIPESRCNTTLR